uniref:Solute carrier family 22 member 7b, tandem duplicate 1 n=1 Tax=Cyprinus carpio TaxID=7962 RepID=A0A8C1Z192_CYPCA
MFAIMRFFTGMGLTHKVCVEWADIAHRTIAGVIISFDWFFSTMILPGIAYLINDWRPLVITVTAPLILAVITWRQHNIRYIKPEGMTFRTLASVITAEDRGDRKYSYLDLVRFRVAFTYYGNSLNISGFGLNLYLTQFIYGAIELPSKLVAYLCLDKLGRRYSQMGTLITTGEMSLVLSLDLWLPRTVIFVQGKGFLEASFTCVFLYNTELYPTVLQQNGLGYSSFVGRVGVSLAPLVSLHSGFGLNLYLTQFIYGAIELPSKLVAYLCLDKLGRRYSQMGTLITTGVCISINVIIPRGKTQRTIIYYDATTM